MTTIAYDGVSLASDSQLTLNQYRLDTNTQKIFEPSESEKWFVEGSRAIAFGVAGPFAAIQLIRSTLAGVGVSVHTRWPEGLSMSYIVVTEQGVVYTGGQEADSTTPWLAEVRPPIAVGSGCEFALGAMAAGADSERAVEIAKRFDTSSGGQVQVLHLVKSPITD